MPEGPEIHRVADQLSEALLGEKIDDAYFGFPRLRAYLDSVVGARVSSITARGKALYRSRRRRLPPAVSVSELPRQVTEAAPFDPRRDWNHDPRPRGNDFVQAAPSP